MDFPSLLESGRRDFLSSVSTLEDPLASAKLDKTTWSILECVEHVILTESRYQEWLANADPIDPQPNPQKELRLFSMIRSRLTKVDCPDAFWPQRRFRTLAPAIAEFNSIRDRSIATTANLGRSLYSLGFEHPFFGKINAAEAIQLMDGHARRHADQIREIAAAHQTRV